MSTAIAFEAAATTDAAASCAAAPAGSDVRRSTAGISVLSCITSRSIDARRSSLQAAIRGEGVCAWHREAGLEATEFNTESRRHAEGELLPRTPRRIPCIDDDAGLSGSPARLRSSAGSAFSS